jgi:hypothetical protein
MQKKKHETEITTEFGGNLSFNTHLIAMSFFSPFNLIFLYDQTLSIDVVFPLPLQIFWCILIFYPLYSMGKL